MSRKATLSFIRSDFYEPVRERIMLGMKIGMCQLSKLYAYNGLMLSGGTRIDGIDLFSPHRVIVVDNKIYETTVKVITAEGEFVGESVKRYTRADKLMRLKVLRHDGEGIISKEYSEQIDRCLCGDKLHTSFQIRMPFVKGMLHEMDFKKFYKAMGVTEIMDMWGTLHPVSEVEIILTKSQVKCIGWLADNNMTWEDYLSALRKYRHTIYITNVSKENPDGFTELNYQFLSTVDMTADEFRPLDLPFGWDHSPTEDNRHWVTKETEIAYYQLCCDSEARLAFFTGIPDKIGSESVLAGILEKNPLMIGEDIFQSRLTAKAESILQNYSLGKLMVAGDNRFLSDDLIDLLLSVGVRKRRLLKKAEREMAIASGWLGQDAVEDAQYASEALFYAPEPEYEHGDMCILLRNPHISRNEEIQLFFSRSKNKYCREYLSHLTDIVIAAPGSLTAERLGGADFDGDMVKTISDPLLNECVNRNYMFDKDDRHNGYGTRTRQEAPNIYMNNPLLHIPAEEPKIRDAGDWHERFEAVKDTFSTRVGLISNAAFRRSTKAYDENSTSFERRKYEHEIEMLAILTGLEIDSAKSGIKPDLSEYLSSGSRTGRKSVFLKYKELIAQAERRREWYQPTHRKRLQEFFGSIDWDQVSSNVERLPYLSMMLKKHTPRIKDKPAADEQLFSFAQDEDWKEELDQPILKKIKCLLDDYDACLSRIRACRAPLRTTSKKSDIDRILFARGQEEIYDTDELYALFQQIPDERVEETLGKLKEARWQYLKREDREELLSTLLPEIMFEDYIGLLCDFRSGGFRLVGDILLDIHAENTAADRKRYTRDGDSDHFRAMMNAYLRKPFSMSARGAVSAKCREILRDITDPGYAVRYFAALGRRKQMFDILPDKIEENLIRRSGTDA